MQPREDLVGQPLRRTGALAVPPADEAAIEAAATKVLSRARGQNAPDEAARLVRLTAKLPFAEGLAEERATFLRLRDSDQAKALRHVFFAERAAAKVDGLEGVEPRRVQTVGIVGTGLMGSGIAVAALDAGYSVIGVETTQEAADKGRERIAALLDRAVKSGRLDEAARTARLSRLSVTASAEDLADADLVIEAVFDDLAVKTELFARLDGIVRPDTILATNTSYLDPDVIAAATARPERVLGLHFFSPANIMRLVEVVRCARTAPDVLATGLAVAKKLGKLPDRLRRLRRVHRQPNLLRLSPRSRIPARRRRAAAGDRRGDGRLRLRHGSFRGVRSRGAGDRLGATQAPGGDARP